MRAVIAALFRCGIFGACYGAFCSVFYVAFTAIAEGIGQRSALYPLVAFPVAVPYALMFGLPDGFLAGVIGGSLGGPLGWGIGGLVGPAVSICLLVRNVDLPGAIQIATLPSLMGAGVGLVLGWDLRRREPTVIGGAAVTKSVYHSSLGRWLGWRNRHRAGAS